MLLKDVVDRFSTDEFADVFDTLTRFNGSLQPFAEVTNSGLSAQRRILETIPTATIPDKRTIQRSADSSIFLVGALNVDFWASEAIRNKYPVLIPNSSPGTVTGVDSLLEAEVAGTPLTPDTYAFPFFVKREPLKEEMSDVLSGFDLYFSSYYIFEHGDILHLGSDYYRLTSDTWIDGGGFSVAKAIKLESPVQIFDISSSDTVFDPVTDTYGSTPTVDVPCFVEVLEKNYDFSAVSFSEVEAGDRAISILKSSVPDLTTNSRVGDEYRVIAVRDLDTFWIAQCRRLS